MGGTRRPFFPTLLALACLALAGGCDKARLYLGSGEVGWNLKKAIRDRHAKEVDLALLAPFEWDQVFLFAPYARKEDVCAALGLVEPGCASTITRESESDGEMLMVFRNRGKIVHVEMHYRIHGDFTPITYAQPLTRKESVFVVLADGESADGHLWLRLEPKRARRVP
jgi:hypothetical protein